jgi:hypothetical protein
MLTAIIAAGQLAMSNLLSLPLQQPDVPPPPKEVEIPGWYTFGTPDEPFVGVATVQPNKEAAGAFVIHWLAPGAQPVQGVAFRDGNYLWVSWRQGQAFGICRYRIEAGPKLVGDRGSNETLTFLRAK